MAMVVSACGRSTPPPLELWLAGDVYLGTPRDVVDDALQAELRGFGVVNLEGPVGAPVDDAFRLIHDPAVFSSLAADGVALASIENNHALDAGPGDATADALGGAGIAAFGGGRVASRDGVTFAEFDLSGGAPEGLGGVLSALPHPLVVAFHVTGDPTPAPSEGLQEAVDVAVQARAGVIVAHGTHVFGPVERRGDTVIAWGLGNLAFDCRCTNHTDGLVLVVGLAEATTARVVPIRAGLDGAPATLAGDPEAYLDTLGALSITPLVRDDVGASF